MRHIFKPLRNFLRKFDQLSLLRGIFHLSNHLDFQQPLPPYLDRANPNGLKGPMQLGFYLWELDTLAREVILHCPHKGGKEVTWPDIRGALNRLKHAENEAFGAGDYDVFAEMTRIAHRQFHWQQHVSHADIARYLRIYRHSGMNNVVQQEYGITSEQLIRGSFALLACYLKFEAIKPEFADNVSKAFGFPIHSILNRFSATLPALQEATKAAQSLDIDWAYTFHPLRLHPLVVLDGGNYTLCPLPGLLARRFTDGLYFDFVKEPDNLSRHLGPAFQAYVGQVLEAANEGNFAVHGEARFGSAKAPKDSVDWIVEDAGGVLFVECKVLRLGHVGRAKLAPLPPIEREYEKLARAVAQTYSTLTDALKGRYPHWSDSGKPIFPIIATLDNWNIFTHVAQNQLNALVSAELARRGIPESILETHPFTVCWIGELERGIQVMHSVGIPAVLDGSVRGDKAGWLFSGYLWSTFASEMNKARVLFSDDLDALVPG